LSPTTAIVDTKRLTELIESEKQLFVSRHPKSAALAERANKVMLSGVPMNWMVRWGGPFPMFVENASGATLKDVDGNEYVDFCLGDTGAMTGHAPQPVLNALADVQAGMTTMMPTEDAIAVAEELGKRFGLPFWQFSLSATDANRFALKIARQYTGRRKILVFNYCYHGTVDDTLVTIENGKEVWRGGVIGGTLDPSETTRVVEFNNIEAVKNALSKRDVACVLAEPAMTNMGIVLPDEGFHEQLRKICDETGTLLILDETHTISAGPGGCTQAWKLRPDMLTIGKPLASGIPCGTYGISQAIADKIRELASSDQCDFSGIGGTLAANALSLKAMRRTLEEVLTVEAFQRMFALADKYAASVRSVIDKYNLDWSVVKLGARAEFHFRKIPPHNGGQAFAAQDMTMEHYLHLALNNRGILLTPFHNMALMSPATTEADVAKFEGVFCEVVEQLVQK
jgi:glutamate-1-semialdehyde 2,1-aminomutase